MGILNLGDCLFCYHCMLAKAQAPRSENGIGCLSAEVHLRNDSEDTSFGSLSPLSLQAT